MSYEPLLYWLSSFSPDAPSAPGRPTATNVDSTELILNWTEPISDGGSPVTNYIIEARDKFGLRWTKINRHTVTDTTFRVTGLKPNDEYQFRVIAENKAGVGRPSDNTEPIIAKPPYGKPVILDIKKIMISMSPIRLQ